MACVRTVVTERADDFKCISSDGSVLALLTDRPYHIMICDSGRVRMVHDVTCTGQLFVSSSSLLATTECLRNHINVWDHTTDKRVAVLQGHTHYVNSVVFSPGLLISASYDGTVRLWRTDNWAAPPVVIEHFDKHNDLARVYGVALSRNSLLASYSMFSNMLYLWRITLEHFQAVGSLEVPDIACIAIQPEGQLLAAGCREDNKIIKIFDTSNINGTPRTLSGWTDDVRSLAFSSCGRQLASSHRYTVRMWDVATGACMRVLRMPTTPPHVVRSWVTNANARFINEFMEAVYISQGKQLLATTYIGDIHTFTVCPWSDRTHHLFGPDLKRKVFQLMCVRARLMADNRLRSPPTEPWLMIMAHLSLCIAESGVIEYRSW